MKNKEIELINDMKAECGCYEFGESCFDRDGNYTHQVKEECNNS